MINIDKSAAPYILSGASLAGLSFVSFFKTINSVARIYNRWVKPVEDPQKKNENSDRYKDIFQACAWLGIFVISTYFFSKVKKEFLEVPYYDLSPKQLDSHALEIKGCEDDYKEKYVNTDSFRNYCLASLRSSVAYRSIVRDDETPTFKIGSDPRFQTVRSALVIADEIKQNAQDLRSNIEQGKQRLEQDFSIFKNSLQYVPVAKGVGINFAQLCRTPFSILSNTTCSSYGEFQNLLNGYEEAKVKVNIYEKRWLSPQRQEQCMKIYDFDYDPDTEKFHSKEHIDELEGSKRSFLGKIFYQINPF